MPADPVDRSREGAVGAIPCAAAGDIAIAHPATARNANNFMNFWQLLEFLASAYAFAPKANQTFKFYPSILGTSSKGFQKLRRPDWPPTNAPRIFRVTCATRRIRADGTEGFLVLRRQALRGRVGLAAAVEYAVDHPDPRVPRAGERDHVDAREGDEVTRAQ